MSENNPVELSSMGTQQPFVLACLDGAALSKAVVDYTVWLALQLDLPVCFLHVIEHNPQTAKSDFSGAIGLGVREDLLNELTSLEENRSRLMRRQGQVMLQAAQEQAQMAGVKNADIMQVHGTLTKRVMELENSVAFMVVGLRGEAHEHLKGAFGAQLEDLIRSSHRPILVVNNAFRTPKTMMLAYDESSAAQRALELIGDEQGFQEFVWVLAHAYSSKHDSDRMLQRAETLLNNSGFSKLTLDARDTPVEEALISCQEHHQVDITVMGAYSHHPLRGFIFGSLTDKMLRRTKKPLLLIH